MRILHTADWHLGKKLEHTSRLPEQEAVLEEICLVAAQNQADAVFIAGDLFDTFNPPTEAVELFYRTVKRLSNNGKCAVIAIAGNHDSPERIEAPDPLARECGIVLAGLPDSIPRPFTLPGGISITKSDRGFLELQLPAVTYPLRLLMTPYASELRLKTFLGVEDPTIALRSSLQSHWQALASAYCNQEGVNMMMAHLYFMKKGEQPPEEPEEEKPILHVGGAQAVYSENIPSQMQYVALGHLHRKQLVDSVPCPVMYSSSPLAYSFAEANQQKYVLLIDAEPATPVTITEIPLQKGKRLLRFRNDDIGEILQWLESHPDDLVELTIVTNDFLTAEQRKQLHAAHPAIINIIPELKSKDALNASATTPDINKGIQELFVDYFRQQKGQPPNESILNLFNEVLSTEENL